MKFKGQRTLLSENDSLLLKHRLSIFMGLLSVTLSLFVSGSAKAQCSFSGFGCSGTNYANYGIFSTGAATLEYDNFVSAFHATTVRESNGDLKIWGEQTKFNGTQHLISPTVINSVNFPGLTGTPLKVAIGSDYITNNQTILLTTDGLWAWGSTNAVLSNNAAVKSTAALGKVALGLPMGVQPANVKMLFATYENLAITTCNGDVWILTNQTGAMRGDGTLNTPTGYNRTWSQVTKTDGSPLTGVVATRGAWGVFIALTYTGEIYTWGARTYLGNGTAVATGSTARTRATLMQAPSTTDGPIKMIGATGNDNVKTSYYVLYENGKLFSMGDNDWRALGDFTTTNRTSWVRPLYPNPGSPSNAGLPMDDIKWISPNEHDRRYQTINVISADNNRLFCWGYQDGGMLGRPVSGALNPAEPADLVGGSIEVVEAGGHTSLVINRCKAGYGYAGHKINGSMGDGTSTSINTDNYTYETSPVTVCGVVSVAPRINIAGSPSVNDDGDICVGTSVVLDPTPAGGTFAITSGAAYATIVDDVLYFNAATPANQPVVVSYSVTTPECGPVTETRRFTSIVCTPTVTIPGRVWNDANGDAVQGGTGETGGLSNNMWANLVGPDGSVIASAKVNANGTFTFVTSKTLLTTAGNYTVVLTNNPRRQGVSLTDADTPNNSYGYTGINRGTTATADPANRSGKLNVGDLSTAADNSTLAAVGFGISNDPAVLPVTFGAISAKITGNGLVLNWVTEKEKNNDYFEIQASVDGIQFTTIGTVKSLAENGNSDTVIRYDFTKEVSKESLAVVLGIALLITGGLGAFRSRKFRIQFLSVVAGGLLLFSSGCKKAYDSTDNNEKVFIRIVQVDKDGGKSYSKIINAVKE